MSGNNNQSKANNQDKYFQTSIFIPNLNRIQDKFNLITSK